jgi:hypothetical protein
MGLPEMFMRKKKFSARKTLSTLIRHTFRVEALEPRILLSADPVMGALQAILPDDNREDAIATGSYDIINDLGYAEFAMTPEATETDNPVQPQPAGTLRISADDLYSVGIDTLAYDPVRQEQREAFLDVALNAVESAIDSDVVVVERVSADATGPVEIILVDSAMLANLQAQSEGGPLLLGSDNSNVVFRLLNVSQNGESMPLVFDQDLILKNPMAGGEVFIDSELSTGSLTIYGSGHTTIISSSSTSADEVLISDSVEINGDISITAGNDGSGTLQIGSPGLNHSLNGDGDLSADTLALFAPGNIRIAASVGNTDPLAGLSIGGVGGDAPDNVTFDGEVVVNGDLVIEASGIVTFKQALLVGGNLSITGAATVIFEAGLSLTGSGDVFVEADEIAFNGGGENVVGAGMLTLRPFTLGLAIEVGSPANSQTSNTLNIDIAEIQKFADGFSKIVIGREVGGHAEAGAGAVRIGAMNVEDQPTFRDSVEIYGGSIRVEDFNSALYTLLVYDDLKLDAENDIEIFNRIEVGIGALNDLVLYSASGAITQADAGNDGAGSEPIRAADLNARATAGILLPFTEVGTLTALNVGLNGDIAITETAIGAGIQISSISQSNPDGAGHVILTTTNGTITVAGSGISVAGSGGISLSAGGASDIVQNQDIGSQGGAIEFVAGGAITMADGVSSRSVSPSDDSGSVTYLAGTSITLSHIEADGTITLTAQNGAISDGLSGDTANLESDTALVTLDATGGIGSGAAPLQTLIDGLAARNTLSGGLYIVEHTALRITGDAGGGKSIDLAGVGADMSVVTIDGGITVEGVAASTGSTGNMLLSAVEAVEGTAANVDIRADITSTSGSITMLADDDILIDNQTSSAPTLRALASGKTLDLQADNAIVMEAAAQLITHSGNQRLLAAAGGIVLGQINAFNATESGTGGISLRAGTSIADADAGDPQTVNVTATNLRIDAVTGIGSGANALEVQVETLAANSLTSGGVFLNESNGLTVGSVLAIAVNRVGGNGATSAVGDGDATISGITTGADGALVLTTGGDTLVSQALSASGAGNVRVDVSGTLTLDAALDAGSGHISLLASGGLTQNALGDVATSGSGGIDVQADSIAMSDGASATAVNGNIRYVATDTLTLGSIITTADVSLSASSITDSGTSDTDISADELRIVSTGTADGQGAGTAAKHLEISVNKLAADVNGTGTGGLFLTEANAILIGTLNAINVQQVGADGSTLTATSDSAQSEIDSDAHLVLVTTAGSLETLATGGAITASGNALLQAGGANSDITLGAALTNTTGHSSLNAGRDLLQNANIEATGSGKTLDLVAGRHIVMADATRTGSSDGNILLQAGADITLETLDAGTADVSVSAGNDILDQDSDANGAASPDIEAAGLLLNAGGGIGTGSNHLEIAATTLSANAGADGIFLSESDGLTVDSLAIQINRVDGSATATATTHLEQDDLETTGHLVLISATGDLTLSDEVSAMGAGNVLLQATVGAITQNNALDGGSGHISLISGASYTQQADITTTGAGTIDLQAGGSIGMDDGTQISGAANIRIVAGTTLTLGSIITTADVSLSASSITDSGTSDTDVSADELRIVSTGTADGQGAGTAAKHLEISVNKLAADVNGTGTGGLFLTEANAILIGTLNAINVQQVGADGSTLTATSDSAQSEIDSDAHLVLVTTAGSLETLATGGAITASGNALLQAGGANSDITLGAALTNTTGHSSLNAGRDLLQNANIEATGSGKTLDLVAGRHIVMADATRTGSSDGNILLQAGADITLETLDAGTADVSVSAGNDILDQDSDANGAASPDIEAAGLLLNAGGGIGTGSNHLEIAATTLSANAGADGIFLSESDGLTVDSLTIQINRVDGSATASATTHLEQDDLETTGHLVLISATGDLTLSDEVSAMGAGNVLLQATVGAITQNNALDGGSGHISLISGASYTQQADITTTGAGTIDLQAGGSIDMDDGTQISGAANIRIVAGTTLTLGSIITTADVSLSASSITDSGTSDTDISADELRIVSTGTADGQGAGTAAKHLEISVNKLAADVNGTGTGGLFLTEANAILIGTLNAINVQQVGADGSTLTATSDSAQSEIDSDAHLVLVTTAGSLETLATGGAITASGNALLQAGGANSDITLGAALTNTTGHSSLNAGRDLLQNANIEATGSGKTLDLVAGRHIVMADTTRTGSSDGNILLQAGADITLETLDAGTADVSVSAGNDILDQDSDANGAASPDIEAAGLLLNAGGGIGTGSNHLEIAATTLSANAGADGIFLSESDGLTVDSLTIQINRVDGSATASATSHLEQDDLETTGHLVLISATGDLTLSDEVSAMGAGNVLLQATVGAITQNNALDGGSGHISLISGASYTQQADITTTGAGTIDLQAGGSIGMDDGTQISGAANIRIVAGTTLTWDRSARQPTSACRRRALPTRAPATPTLRPTNCASSAPARRTERVRARRPSIWKSASTNWRRT